MYVTKAMLRGFGVSNADVPTGFCKRSTFTRNFDDAMQKKVSAAITAIDGAVQALAKEGILAKKSRVSTCGISGTGQKSYAYAYIEKENGKEYLALQVNVISGTVYNPKGIVSAFTYWGAFSKGVATGTLDDLEPIKGQIVQKLKEYRAEHANEARPAGAQAVSMQFSEGLF